MNLPALITDLALILIYAGLATLLFKWLRQPLVLGYIVAGFLAGPHITFLPTVADNNSISTWAEIGVVFLMFGLGLEFSLKKLMKVGVSALTTTATSITAMFIIGYIVGKIMGWTSIESVFLGSMMSVSSTTAIIKTLRDLHLNNKRFSGVVFGALIVEDLFAILMLVLLPTIALSQNFEGMTVANSLLKVGFFFTLWFVVGIYLIPIILKHIRQFMNDEMLLIIALAFCLGMVILAAYTGFSVALGAFIMGSILAETIEAERIEGLVKPVKDLFGAVFFVSIGMLLDPQILSDYALPIVIITLTTIVMKSSFASLGVLISGKTVKTSIRAGFSMAQVGEFAFIIAALGMSLGVLSEFIYPIIISVSVITTFTTPYMIRFSEPFSEWFYARLPAKSKHILERYASGGRTVNRESDWQQLLKSFFFRWLIYVVMLVAIHLLSARFISPSMLKLFGAEWGNIISMTVSLLLMSPFIVALIANRFHAQDLFMSLWNDSRYNRGRLVSLVLLRIATAGFFVVMELIRYMHLGAWEGLIGSGIILILLFLFRRDLSEYSRLEQRFLKNLNQRKPNDDQLQENFSTNFHNELKNKDIHLSEVLIPIDSPFIGKSIMELAFRKQYGVSIVSILRGKKRINIPDKEEIIYPYDRIVIVGTDEQSEVFWKKLEMQKATAPPDNREVRLQSFTVDESFPFIGQSILEFGIHSRCKCLFVGLDRNGSSIMNPKSSTVFTLGDLVWLVGEDNFMEQILQSEAVSGN